ncbi:MAG: Tad domain-containing protein [Chloroflexota bacterium]|nr:Tad domain-containing protein [Chloroflexota bacterium]MDQ5867266.1 Tad domain-containing protein [Chloroflexota bacterium]
MHNKRVKGTFASRRSLPEKSISKAGRQKTRGQAMVIIALAMFVLIGLVGLAIDGGSMYLQRRAAQNSTDGAALAGTSTMLSAYQGMLYENKGTVTDSNTKYIEDEIFAVIMDYATVNGVVSDTVTAYFVNDDKQVVSASAGRDDNNNVVCGTSAGLAPCKVGQNGYVPWTRGVKGITVTGRAQTSAFFMSLFGWNTISAEASATAFMGPALETGPDVNLLPIGFFTTTERLRQMQTRTEYTLISGNRRRVPTATDRDPEWDVSGNWGFINFNENAQDPNVVNAWINCGYNPRALTEQAWLDFCPEEDSPSVTEKVLGPTVYWTGAGDAPDNLDNRLTAPRVEWKGIDGKGPDWWLLGSSGVSNSCDYFKRELGELGGTYFVPVFDKWHGGGSNTYYHLLTIAVFTFNNDFKCQSPRQEWAVKGTFGHAFAAGTAGTHGDLTHSSVHTVFLEP